MGQGKAFLRSTGDIKQWGNARSPRGRVCGRLWHAKRTYCMPSPAPTPTLSPYALLAGAVGFQRRGERQQLPTGTPSRDIYGRAGGGGLCGHGKFFLGHFVVFLFHTCSVGVAERWKEHGCEHFLLHVTLSLFIRVGGTANAVTTQCHTCFESEYDSTCFWLHSFPNVCSQPAEASQGNARYEFRELQPVVD